VAGAGADGADGEAVEYAPRVTVILTNSRNSDRLDLGPFAFVQVTYLLLRDDDDHDLATYNPVTDRWTVPDGRRFTDLIVYPTP
jgi:hypothetical protein